MRRHSPHQAILRQFAVRVLQSAFTDTLDGAAAQELGVELGLLRKGRATPRDCRLGFEGEPGDLIYRLVPWLKPQAPGSRGRT